MNLRNGFGGTGRPDSHCADPNEHLCVDIVWVKELYHKNSAAAHRGRFAQRGEETDGEILRAPSRPLPLRPPAITPLSRRRPLHSPRPAPSTRQALMPPKPKEFLIR